MNSKLRVLFIIFLTLFFSKAFPQNNEQSDHPLLDKYYPQPKKDTAKAIAETPVASPAIKQPTTNTPLPVTTIKTAPKPTSPIVTPVAKPVQVAVPATIDNVSVVTPPSPSPAPEISTPLSTSSVDLKNIPTINDTASVIKPAAAIFRRPVKPVDVVQPRSPAPPPYMDTRLGSSTRQYDTYEKNSYGAGSVTTSPK